MELLTQGPIFVHQGEPHHLKADFRYAIEHFFQTEDDCPCFDALPETCTDYVCRKLYDIGFDVSAMPGRFSSSCPPPAG